MSSYYGQGLLDLLKCRLKLTKHDDKNDVYLDYDAWNPPGSGARLLSLEMTRAMFETGEITVRIEDHANDLNASVGCGNKFIAAISADGNYADANNWLAGWMRVVGVDRPGGAARVVTMRGYGNMVRLNERVSNFYRIIKREGDGVTPDFANDNSTKTSELIKDLFEDVDHLPIGGPLEPFTTTGVEEINEKLASIRMAYVEFSQILNRFLEASGAVVDIDANDKVVAKYGTFQDSGLTLQSVADFNVDLQEKVGYFIGWWRYQDSIEKDKGFANRIFGIGGTDFHLIIDENADAGTPEEFHSKDIAMQFIPPGPRVDALALKLSLNAGTGADLPADVAGQVVLNKESSNTPEGEQVGSFTIWKNLLSTSVSEPRVNLQMFDRRLQVDKKYWIILQKLGSVGNHVRWHHSDGTGGVNATRPAGTWTTNTNSRKYAHRLYISRRVAQEASDPASIAKYGLVEKVVRAPYILEASTMDLLLTSMLQYTARRQRSFGARQILAPKTLMHPLTTVRIKHTGESVDQQAEIERVTYRFTEDNALGTRYVDITPIAFVA